jgi:hypothetical protein
MGVLRCHTSALKPFLTEENMVSRVAYCLDEIDGAAVTGGEEVRYKNMFDRVDIDEKWFYQTSNGKNYILTVAEFKEEAGVEDDDEATPHRTIRHKCHIPKAMFLCAQARPRWDPHRNAMWDGKLGLWPIGHWAPAQRTSINRPAGTIGERGVSTTTIGESFPSNQGRVAKGAIGNDQTLSFEFNKMAPPHILIQTMSYNYKDYKNWTCRRICRVGTSLLEKHRPRGEDYVSIHRYLHR